MLQAVAATVSGSSDSQGRSAWGGGEGVDVALPGVYLAFRLTLRSLSLLLGCTPFKMGNREAASGFTGLLIFYHVLFVKDSDWRLGRANRRTFSLEC